MLSVKYYAELNYEVCSYYDLEYYICSGPCHVPFLWLKLQIGTVTLPPQPSHYYPGILTSSFSLNYAMAHFKTKVYNVDMYPLPFKSTQSYSL